MLSQIVLQEVSDLISHHVVTEGSKQTWVFLRIDWSWLTGVSQLSAQFLLD